MIEFFVYFTDMTIVYGQIESLTRLREILDQKGISRFDSVEDINCFSREYEFERQRISNRIEQDLNIEIDKLRTQKNKIQQDYDELRAAKTENLNKRITRIQLRLDQNQEYKPRNRFKKIFRAFFRASLMFLLSLLKRNFSSIIQFQTRNTRTQLIRTKNKVREFSANKVGILQKRSSKELRQLDYTKEVVDELYPLIAGAIGERKVENELKKLPGHQVLFNDFSVKFNPPVYNRKENDRIFSIQIDHLLVTNSGIFLIETKNWSQRSLERFDLRSPVDQIRRTSYALFVLLNGEHKNLALNIQRHHWGERKIPIRNIVVMINHKPREQFKYVQVKTLSELNRYISYFDPIFNDAEVTSISEYLKMIQN